MTELEYINKIFRIFVKLEISKNLGGGYSIRLGLPLRTATDGEGDRLWVCLYGESVEELLKQAVEFK